MAMMNKTHTPLTGEEEEEVEEADEPWATRDQDTEKLKPRDVGDRGEEEENKNALQVLEQLVRDENQRVKDMIVDNN